LYPYKGPRHISNALKIGVYGEISWPATSPMGFFGTTLGARLIHIMLELLDVVGPKMGTTGLKV